MNKELEDFYVMLNSPPFNGSIWTYPLGDENQRGIYNNCRALERMGFLASKSADGGLLGLPVVVAFEVVSDFGFDWKVEGDKVTGEAIMFADVEQMYRAFMRLPADKVGEMIRPYIPEGEMWFLSNDRDGDLKIHKIKNVGG